MKADEGSDRYWSFKGFCLARSVSAAADADVDMLRSCPLRL